MATKKTKARTARATPVKRAAHKKVAPTAKKPTDKRKGHGKGGPPKGNQYWRQRSKHGRDKIFASPEALMDACAEYFDWVEATPIMEQKTFMYLGRIVKTEEPRMRPMTMGSLCIFLNIDVTTWFEYKKRNDFSQVIATCELIMREQKFAGAASNQLNGNIISRDLGLIDKKQTEVTTETQSQRLRRLNAMESSDVGG